MYILFFCIFIILGLISFIIVSKTKEEIEDNKVKKLIIALKSIEDIYKTNNQQIYIDFKRFDFYKNKDLIRQLLSKKKVYSSKGLYKKYISKDKIIEIDNRVLKENYDLDLNGLMLVTKNDEILYLDTEDELVSGYMSEEVIDFDKTIINFSFNAKNKTANVIGFKDNWNYKHLIIPDNVIKDNKTYKVKGISTGAFIARRLESVYIPNTVTHIGEGAFMKNNIKLLIIGNALEQIDNGAFANNSIYYLYLPESMMYIDNLAFFRNKIKEVYLPEGLKEIGEVAFMDNEIIRVDIPESVTYIGEDAFSNNKSKIMY